MNHLKSFFENQGSRDRLYEPIAMDDPYYQEASPVPESMHRRLATLFSGIDYNPQAALFRFLYVTSTWDHYYLEVKQDADDWFYLRTQAQIIVQVFRCDGWDGLVQCFTEQLDSK